MEAIGEKTPPKEGIFQSVKKAIVGGMTSERKSMATKIEMNKNIQYEVEENPFDEEIQASETSTKKRGEVANS